MFGFTHVRDRAEGHEEVCDKQPAAQPTSAEAAPRLAFQMDALEERIAPGIVWGD